MLSSKQILIRGIVLGASVLNLAGCGQTGPLYLPKRTAPAKPASAPDTPKAESPMAPPQVD